VGFKHWDHDFGSTITPLEAGLGFTIDWSKDFIGKDALEAQRRDGLPQRLIVIQIEEDALMLHDRPIFEVGRQGGLTTSGATGARTGLNLAFGLIQTKPGATLDQTCARSVTMRVEGKDCGARPYRRAPNDPKGERMRA